jgi:TPR repeat protein
MLVAGIAAAQYNVGLYYFEGREFIPRNEVIAAEYWKMASEQQHPLATVIPSPSSGNSPLNLLLNR